MSSVTSTVRFCAKRTLEVSFGSGLGPGIGPGPGLSLGLGLWRVLLLSWSFDLFFLLLFAFGLSLWHVLTLSWPYVVVLTWSSSCLLVLSF